MLIIDVFAGLNRIDGTGNSQEMNACYSCGNIWWFNPKKQKYN